MNFIKYQHNFRDKKIVVCPRCDGKGIIEEATDDEKRYKSIRCPMCFGYRVLEREIIVKYNSLEDAYKSKEELAALEY